MTWFNPLYLAVQFVKMFPIHPHTKKLTTPPKQIQHKKQNKIKSLKLQTHGVLVITLCGWFFLRRWTIITPDKFT